MKRRSDKPRKPAEISAGRHPRSPVLEERMLHDHAGFKELVKRIVKENRSAGVRND